MFEFLRKKISDFTEKLKGTAQKKEAEDAVQKPELRESAKADERLQTDSEGIEQASGEKAVEETAGPSEAVDAEGGKAVVEMPKIKDNVKRELKARAGIAEAVKGVVLGRVKIRGEDAEQFFFDFELALLEADVEQSAASEIVAEIKRNLVGKEVPAGKNLGELLKNEIRQALAKIMETEKIDFWKRVEQKKPFVILFLGPNGAGKTTTIAKIAFALKQRGKNVIIAAADTFRAASIEQLETHAERIGVKVVKQGYGADPAAVAFDAIAAAKARNVDVVLIDSAGRQETNKNLMQELKKIGRVAKPDLKIYVGESFTGQALLGMAEEFTKEVGVDGFVLTKIDADVKGGTAISLLYRLKKPILFVGVGQNYADLAEFSPQFIIDRIL